ncbi:MAG: hypothetical protein K5682_10125 [Lachnospiraceae bacterium]|nr:hypothetical protein [Lachnospiraceae bacterium]
MKLLNKALFGILGLVVLLCALILLCAASPALREKLAGLTAAAAEQESITETMETEGTETITETTETEDGGLDFFGLFGRKNKEESASADADGNTTDPAGTGAGTTTGTSGNSKMPEGLQQLTSEYVSPGRNNQDIPSAVSGKSGMKEIGANNSEISDEEAEDLEDELDYGDTGDGYTFDSTFYPYYAMLDSQGQHLYRQIYANALNLYKTFAPIEQVSTAGLKNIFAAVFNDHPELFWLNTSYAAKYSKSGENVSITLSFNETADNLGSYQTLFENAASSIIQEAEKQKNDYQKEKYVHNALVERVIYNSAADMNQSAYSALVGGQSVCAGYSRAMQYMMIQLGIPCYYCTGYAGESHAWNIVKLDDGYYNVDSTWDDVEGGRYDYFNKTDSDYATTHVRTDLAIYLPACEGTAYRNLEKDTTTSASTVSGNTATKHSLSDFGLTESAVLKSLDAYFADCYSKIVYLGKGNHTFSNVVDGSIINSVKQAYSQETYQLGYMDNALSALGGGTCQMSIITEEMTDNLYLVTHVLSIQ